MSQMEVENGGEESTEFRIEKPVNGFAFWRETLQSARFILAPMVDQSELAFRLMVRKYAVECTYSPMFNASVFVRDPRYRQECLQICRERDRPFIIQFCSSNAEAFVKSAQLVEELCEAVDLNLGCPQQIAKRGHYGAFLQDEWDLVFDILNQAVRKCRRPITCKIRIFEDQNKTIRYAQMIERAGVSLIGVHGRYREQKGPVTGMADWQQIKAVKKSVKVPVFANGNIQSLDDVDRCFKETGVEGVMSAEGLLHNPALFTGRPIPVWQACYEYLDLVKLHPPPLSFIRGHMFKFLHHCVSLPEHEKLRTIMGKTHSIDELLNVVNQLEQFYHQDFEKFKSNFNISERIHPDQWPAYYCKPYYRPPPNQFNSKVVVANDENDNDSTPVRKTDRTLKRKLKAEKQKKKLEAKRQRVFDLCVKCKNPSGVKCSIKCCKSCCKLKSEEEKVDCSMHRCFFKPRIDENSKVVPLTSSDFK